VRNLIACSVIVLLLFSMVACSTGNYTGVTQSTNLPTEILGDLHNESSEPIEENEATKYPNDIVHDYNFEQEDKDGYIVTRNITVWEPALSNEEYAHPAFQDFLIPICSGDGDVWIIPFTATIKNTTSGFGSTDIKYMMGVGVSTNPINNWSRTITADESGLRSLGFSFFKTALYYDDGTHITKPYDCFVLELTLGENETEIAGYMIFEDVPRTPKTPNGVDASVLENRFFYEGIVNPVTGVFYSNLNPFVQFTKDDGGSLVIVEG